MSIQDKFMTAGTIVLWIIIVEVATFAIGIIGCLLFNGFAKVACAIKRKSRRKKLQRRREARYGGE